ncbi:hypothetical protein ABBQ38_008418 [Trebouxia sp. C0009 RCD-2024]
MSPPKPPSLQLLSLNAEAAQWCREGAGPTAPWDGPSFWAAATSASRGRLRPLPTDTSPLARSGIVQRALCELINMGAFYLAELSSKQCCPMEGAAVHGGLHVLQVAPSFGDAPGVRAVKWALDNDGHSRSANLTATLVFCGPAHYKVALVHGILEKVCPHNSTGRADYFGSTVNRAARLLCVAKPGQMLAEAPVMEAVLKEWMGADSASMLLKTKSSALSQSGEFSSSAVDTGNTSDTPPSPKLARNRTAPNLRPCALSFRQIGSTTDYEPSSGVMRSRSY